MVLNDGEIRAALTGYAVSRETLERLRIFASELTRWQRGVNLVSSATIPVLWTRHIADCLQLSGLAEGDAWVDLGSGAGLPGLVLAAADPDRHVTAIESDARKCAFLRHAATAMGLRVQVIQGRIESTIPALPARRYVVTARALGPLNRLLRYGEMLWPMGSIGLFPKGRDHASELTEARESWKFDVELVSSRTDPDARILRVTNVMSRLAG